MNHCSLRLLNRETLMQILRQTPSKPTEGESSVLVNANFRDGSSQRAIMTNENSSDPSTLTIEKETPPGLKPEKDFLFGDQEPPNAAAMSMGSIHKTFNTATTFFSVWRAAKTAVGETNLPDLKRTVDEIIRVLDSPNNVAKFTLVRAVVRGPLKDFKLRKTYDPKK